MMARMISAASFLVLLFLPPKSCLPALPRFAPLSGSMPLPSCKPPGTQQQRAGRSAPSSKRRDGRPNSLDLTFHLLREFLEMSREERLAQKARSNKILLHNIGK
uniref:corticoliberin-like n=1 Tax=Euleptes europaea TaxID=460621 RepID=UPI0025422298|nr:corticoliberin-like [Euleptes europaea]